MSDITNWKESATQELATIEEIRLDLIFKINDLLHGDFTEKYANVLNNLRNWGTVIPISLK